MTVVATSRRVRPAAKSASAASRTSGSCWPCARPTRRRTLAQFGEARLGGGEVEELALGDQRADPVDLRARGPARGDAVDHVGQRRQRVQRGADRLPAGRLAGQPADSISPHCVSSSVRGIGVAVITSTSVVLALRAQHQALVDAEAVLLVDHREAEVAERHAFLEQRMGADDDRRASRLRGRAAAALRCAALDRAGQQRHRHRAEPSSVRKCCRASSSVGAISARLRAGLHRAQHGQHRDQRLARADIALQQPQHPARRGQVGVDLAPAHAACDAVGVWPKRGQRLRAQPPVARPAPGPARCADPAADQGQRDLPGQHLVIGEAARGWRAAARRPAACTARSAAAKPGQPSRRSRAGSCHSGRSGSRVQRRAMRAGELRRRRSCVSGQTGSSSGTPSALGRRR